MLLPACFSPSLYHQQSHRLGWAICSPSHLHLKHDHLQIPHLYEVSVSLVLHKASEEPVGAHPRGAGAFLTSPCSTSRAAAATSQVQALGSRRSFPGRVGVRMSNGCTAALGSGTTGSQHRNYCGHKGNTNKDHAQQREAGISQHKRRAEALKATFISLLQLCTQAVRLQKHQGSGHAADHQDFLIYCLFLV